MMIHRLKALAPAALAGISWLTLSVAYAEDKITVALNKLLFYV